jgi:hypothetical protein
MREHAICPQNSASFAYLMHLYQAKKVTTEESLVIRYFFKNQK